MAKLPMIYEMGTKSGLTRSNTISMFIYMMELSHSYSHRNKNKYGRITFYDDAEKIVTYRILPMHYDRMRELVDGLRREQ